MTTQTKTTMSDRSREAKAGWRKVKLGELVVPKGSVSGPFGSNIHSKFFTQEGVPVIRGNNLAIGFNPGRYVDNDYIFLSEEKAEELSKSEALPEDIVVTARGTIGQTGIIPKKARYKKYILSANQLRFRIDRKIADPLFVYYWLASKRMVRMMQNVSVNVGVPNLNLGNTRNLPVPIPPLPVQKRIADILSAFDDKIELNNGVSAVLEQMAQAIFKEWLLKNQKSNLKNKKYEVKKIGDVAKVVLGGTPSRLKKEYWGGNIPWINSGKVNEFRIISASENITSEGLKKSNTQLMPKRTTVVAITGATLGRVSLLEIEACANQSVVGIFGSELLSPEFVYLFIKNNILEIIQEAAGGAQQHINKGIVENYPIIVPPKESIVKFNEIIKPMFDRISKNIFENQKLAALRDLLLPKLMSGEIRL